MTAIATPDGFIQLEYKVTIEAPGKKVWNTMLQPDTYREWVNAAWPGSFFEGEWKAGGKLRFISEDGSGTLATLIDCKPYELIVARHIAVLNPGGVEDRESDIAKGWIGTTESYFFNSDNERTDLTVQLSIKPGWEKMFNDGWPKALAKLKEISEQ